MIYCSSHLLKQFQHKLIFFHVLPFVFHYSAPNFSFKKMFSTHQNRNDAFEFLFHQITDYFVIEILNWFPLQRQEITLRWKQLQTGKKKTGKFQNISESTWLEQSFCQSFFTHHICFPNIAFTKIRVKAWGWHYSLPAVSHSYQGFKKKGKRKVL